MKNGISILIALLGIIGCQKDADYELPYSAPKTAVECRMNAGDTIYALMGSSAYILDADNPPLLSNFKVRLFEDGILIDSLSSIPLKRGNGLNANYKSNTIAKVNKNYTLEIHHPELGYSTGSDLIPSAISELKVEMDENSDLITISFRDHEELEDYYLVEMILIGDDTYAPIIQKSNDPSCEMLYKTGDIFNDEGASSGLSSVYRDTYFNGQLKKFSLEFYYNGVHPNSDHQILVRVKHISKDYYLHERSKGRQETSPVLMFSEPVNIYSNVSNAYGAVISSYTHEFLFSP